MRSPSIVITGDRCSLPSIWGNAHNRPALRSVAHVIVYLVRFRLSGEGLHAGFAVDYRENRQKGAFLPI